MNTITPTQFRQWIRKQLDSLEALENYPNWDEQVFEDVRGIVKEAGALAAKTGIPHAVSACRLRAGGITVAQARHSLAECLAAVPSGKRVDRTQLTPPEVAKRYGVSADTVRSWIESGQLRATNIGRGKKKPRFRIEPQALEEFDRKRTAESGPPTPIKRRRNSTGLTVTKFSDRRGTTGARSSRP